MKNIAISSAILLLSLSLFSSCKNDFEIAADWKEIPVVYAILSTTDTAQYVKVSKAFIDKKTSALTIAAINDSLYFPGVAVELHKMWGTIDSGMISLYKVDLNIEGYQKPGGIFSTSPNWAYKTKAKLNPKFQYKLVVRRPDGTELTTAQIILAQDFKVTSPNPVLLSSRELKFINTNSAYPAGDGPTKIAYRSGIGGKVYDCFLRFRYKEVKLSTTDTVEKFIDWQVISGALSPDSKSKDADLTDDKIVYKQIYPYLANKIPVNASVARIAMKDSMELHFWSGGEEMYTYQLVQNAQNGLTQGNIHPDYTNMSNGLGIMSSRYHKVVSGLTLSPLSLDTLRYGQFTKNLGFQ